MASGKRGQKGFKGQRGKRGQRGPQEVKTKPESSVWSPVVQSNDNISRGRVRGTHPEYSIAQTMRYKSQWERYQKALALAAVGPFAVIGSTYYWEASRKPRPESGPIGGKEDWWPEKPPAKRLADPYQDPYPGYNSPYGDEEAPEQEPPGQSPQPPEPYLPPGTPEDPGTSLPSIPGGQLPQGYSGSPDGFWKVTAGAGDGWEISGDGWTQTGDDSFTNGNGGSGSFRITDGDGEISANVPPPPFTGGQCPNTLYRALGTAQWKNASNGENRSSQFLAENMLGPLSGEGIEIRQDPFFPGTEEGNGFIYYFFGKQNLAGFAFAQPGSASHSTVVSRMDGLPDTCGDPPQLFVP